MLEIPLEALGPVTRERVIIEDKTFILTRPAEADRLLDYPVVRAAFQQDEYLPYWADLWPAARMLAKVIVRENWAPGLEAVELGCGLGLPGLAALSKGLRVIFTDYDATALRFAAASARLNGFSNFSVLQLDWRTPPADLQVPVVLASDLVYELRSVAPLAAMIKRILLPSGTCLLTDQDRVPSHALREALAAQGLAFATRSVRAGEPGGRRVKGTLYRITHKS